jgi:serine protease
VIRPILFSLLFATGLSAQRSTMCQTANVAVDATRNARRIVGCGEGFPDNVLWHLDRSDSVTGELDGKARMRDGSGAVVYVLDTGILRDHAEFARAGGSSVTAGLKVDRANFPPPVCPEPVLTPCHYTHGHGTAVASIIGGATTGVAPGASLVAVWSSLGYFDLAEAFRLIAAHAWDPSTPQFRTAIINISGGGNYGSRTAELKALLQKMVNGVDANGNPDPNGKKFLIVAAAGNSAASGAGTQCDASGNLVNHPAAFGPEIDGVISAGGITRENAMWEGTCKGPLLEMLAPATDLLLASVEGNDLYLLDPSRVLSGTSYAAPYVAGMAARLLQDEPSLTPAELEARLKSSPSRVDGLPVPVTTFPPPGSKRRAARH